MTLESGYLGSINVTQVTTPGSQVSRIPVVSPNGEPEFISWAENSWAEELMLSDGNFRFLKGGVAQGRGVDSSFDLALSNNVTILTLLRVRNVTSYASPVAKAAGAAYPNNGWNSHIAPITSTTGKYTRLDIGAGFVNLTGNNTTGVLDRNWHWDALTLSVASDTVTANSWLDAKKTTANIQSAAGASLFNTNNFIAQAALNDLACVIIFSRVLSEVEILNIMSGVTLPKTVPGLLAYYKMNEGTGVGSSCIDHSGNGHNLLYSTPVWETFKGFNTNVIVDSSKWSLGTNWSATEATSISKSVSSIASATYPLTGITIGSKIRFKCKVVSAVGGSGLSIYIGSTAYVRTYSVGPANYNVVLIAKASNITFATLSGTTDVVITDISVELLEGGESGQPYVLRKQLSPTNWYSRNPSTNSMASLQGSIGFNSAASVVLPNNSNYWFSGNIAMSGWIKTNKDYSSSGIVTYLPFIYGANALFQPTIEAGGKNFVVTVGNNSTINTVTIVLPIGIQHNTWFHYAISIAGSNISLYLNGVFIKEDTLTTTFDNTVAQAIPTLHNSTTQRWIGRSIRLFNRSISATEVEDLFQLDSINNRTGLIGEWLFNEVGGAGATDTSVVGNNIASISSIIPRYLDSPYALPRLKRVGKQLKHKIADVLITTPVDLGTALNNVNFFTLSMWAKFTPASSGYGVLFQMDVGTGHLIQFSTNTAANRNQIDFLVKATTAAGNNYSTLTYKYVSNPIWHLLSVSTNMSTGATDGYVDGIYIGTNTNALGFPARAYTGFEPITKLQFRHGTALDSICMYNRALSPTEHRDIFLEKASRNGLICEYLFDSADLEPANRKCMDTSGNNYHGTWSGGISDTNYVSEY